MIRSALLILFLVFSTKLFPQTKIIFDVGEIISPIDLNIIPHHPKKYNFYSLKLTRNFKYQNDKWIRVIGSEIKLDSQIDKFGFSLKIFYNLTNSFNDIQQKPQQKLLNEVPYNISPGLFYQNGKFKYNIQYGIFGPRLFRIGDLGLPDIYNLPKNTFNLLIVSRVSRKLETKIGVQNIINRENNLMEDSNWNGIVDGDDLIISKIRDGQYLTLGIILRL